MDPGKSPSPAGKREPRIEGIKFELGKILKTQGKATVHVSLLKQAWAREGRPFFLLRPRLEALAQELHCNYKLDKESGNTTFFRRKPDSPKG